METTAPPSVSICALFVTQTFGSGYILCDFLTLCVQASVDVFALPCLLLNRVDGCVWTVLLTTPNLIINKILLRVREEEGGKPAGGIVEMNS